MAYNRGGQVRIILVLGNTNDARVIPSPLFSSWDEAEAELAQINEEIKANRTQMDRQWVSINPANVLAAYLEPTHQR